MTKDEEKQMWRYVQVCLEQAKAHAAVSAREMQRAADFSEKAAEMSDRIKSQKKPTLTLVKNDEADEDN